MPVMLASLSSLIIVPVAETPRDAPYASESVIMIFLSVNVASAFRRSN